MFVQTNQSKLGGTFMYEILEGLTSPKLAEMLFKHMDLFDLTCCEESELLNAEYDLRIAILKILSQRTQEEYDKRNEELGD